MTDHCNVLMVFPRFNANSFWNYQATCEMAGARYPAAPLGLITVASLLPKSWDVRLINRNTEDLSPADIAWADMVMTGGMLPQQWDTLAIIELAHRQGKPVVVGGPGVTSTPGPYRAADFRVLGEAEGIIDTFIAAWSAGVRSGTFEAAKFQADVTKSPVPRFDLLRFRDYLHVGIQFSRGCPFTCEFCDIIELYGRVPRTKTASQVIAELDRLYALGYRGHVDFVDDNLIGNKKAVKAFLPHLVKWQEAHGFPFEFSTEASVNLADDASLLKMLGQANFFAVFIGIESPDPETLAQTQKKQNTRRDLSDSIHRLYEAGLFVLAGFIVGFDSERTGVAAAMATLIEEAAIPIAMVGLLYALPNTQLTRRLEREGRLFATETSIDDGEVAGDQCTAGLNFVTRRARRAVLQDYREVLDQIYPPEPFFARVRRVGAALRIPPRGRGVRLHATVRESGRFLRLMVGITIRRPDMRRGVWSTLLYTARHNPAAIPAVMRMMAIYIHLGPFSRFVIGKIDDQIQAVDDGTWTAPALVVPPEDAKILVH
jgi:radical SAM superfamily enzyme YgiQ (UPF0313 family)